MTEETKLSQVTIDLNTEDIDRLTQELTDIIAGKEITAGSILVIVTQLMIEAAKYVSLTGPKKKELIIYVLRNFVSQSTDIPSDTKKDILAMFDSTIPTTIDLLVAASKSKFAFKVKKNFLTWCGCV
jgi:hypothetical protein